LKVVLIDPSIGATPSRTGRANINSFHQSSRDQLVRNWRTTCASFGNEYRTVLRNSEAHAARCRAVSNVLTKRYGPFDPLMLIAWSSLFTVPQVKLMSLVLEHGQLATLVKADERGWLALAYTVFIG
jgi:hypothetical protein